MKHLAVANSWPDTAESHERSGNGMTSGSCVDIAGLRTRISDQLDRLSAVLMSMMRMNDSEPRSDLSSATRRPDAAMGLVQDRIRMLGQLAVGLAGIEADAIPATGAGYGSTVIGQELFSGRLHQYTLMLGSLVDIEAQQVSLASPIGQALFGCESGEVVEIELPHRRLSLRIVSITTLNDLLETDELVTADV
jgi:transcription elongation GreA/GreB family factor